jgi:hypothetical protein
LENPRAEEGLFPVKLPSRQFDAKRRR